MTYNFTAFSRKCKPGMIATDRLSSVIGWARLARCQRGVVIWSIGSAIRGTIKSYLFQKENPIINVIILQWTMGNGP